MTVCDETLGDFDFNPRWSAGVELNGMVLHLPRCEKLEQLRRELEVEAQRIGV